MLVGVKGGEGGWCVSSVERSRGRGGGVRKKALHLMVISMEIQGAQESRTLSLKSRTGGVHFGVVFAGW